MRNVHCIPVVRQREGEGQCVVAAPAAVAGQTLLVGDLAACPEPAPSLQQARGTPGRSSRPALPAAPLPKAGWLDRRLSHLGGCLFGRVYNWLHPLAIQTSVLPKIDYVESVSDAAASIPDGKVKPLSMGPCATVWRQPQIVLMGSNLQHNGAVRVHMFWKSRQLQESRSTATSLFKPLVKQSPLLQLMMQVQT